MGEYKRMAVDNKFGWVKFYRELADRLLPYKNNRAALIDGVKRAFEIAGMNMPTLDKDRILVDIDPFTVFGLFNRTSMRDETRSRIAESLAKAFSVSTLAPSSYEGIPMLDPRNATFYCFGAYRGDGDIDDLWGFFESALTYVDDPTPENKARVSRLFDVVINMRGNANSKITMGLYWIAPDTYLNLDSRSQWYVYESGEIPEDFVKRLPAVDAKISAEKYFEITDMLVGYLGTRADAPRNLRELSYEAMVVSQRVNDETKADKAQGDVPSANKPKSTMSDDGVHYWVYSPGAVAEHWDEFYKAGIMAIGWDKIGDISEYYGKDEMTERMKECYEPGKKYMNAAYCTWQFANCLKPGDVVFAKKGTHKIVGRGIVTGDYEFDDSRKYFKNVRRVDWTDKGEWDYPAGQAVRKTLTDITAYTENVERLEALFQSDTIEDVEEKEVLYPAYGKEDFLSDVYMGQSDYDVLVHILRDKKNIILKGAPGVGKTYAARRLAYSIMGVEDTERVTMIQFHQSYSYEDFIMGMRPNEKGGFDIRYGVFYDFCKKAEEDVENDYFFIIDEINRGNLSKIFGELFMLIEADKRGTPIRLLYKNEMFSVPENVYIIGMMNTADRSLAMLDYALIRRFGSFEMKPAFDTDGFSKYAKSLSSARFNSLISCVKELNEEICKDDSLGEGFRIGHSFFCGLDTCADLDGRLSEIVEYEIIPLLKEYWFDEPSKVSEWSENLRRSLR